MDSIVPKHHLKGEVCATRPAYREGRVPKAVKVYTVNNESQYILIQNVPSVGTKDELWKLCSNFGPVEDHHILDEYPSEDKYTEVHLIKYLKINSARFAKRKLDDHSFFGGALHVCYAPEYESVAETRAKLQERRKSVASKIRQHCGQTQGDFHQSRGKKYFDGKHLLTDLAQHMPQENTPTMTILKNELLQSENIETSHNRVSNCPNTCTSNTDKPASSQASKNPSQEKNSPEFPCDSNTQESDNSPFLTFNIPPPPKSFRNYQPRIEKYEFARVRSHHASLPPSFTSSSDEPGKSFDKDRGELQTAISHTLDGASPRKESEATGSNKHSPVVIKDYKRTKPALKFVPRQTIKRNADEAEHPKIEKSENAAIRKRAFLLADVQGPSDLPGRRAEKPQLRPGVENSYLKSISHIRSKISKVISDNVKPP